MPSKSQAQRGYLAVHFGKEWMRKHHYDNPGKLPARVHGLEESAKMVKRNKKKGK